MRYGPNKAPEVEVIVSYDSRGKRATKTFTCPYQARRFYSAKMRAGKNPSTTTKKKDDENESDYETSELQTHRL